MPDSEHLQHAREAARAAHRTERLRRLIESAPPLTEDQKARLQQLVRQVPTLP